MRLLWTAWRARRQRTLPMFALLRFAGALLNAPEQRGVYLLLSARAKVQRRRMQWRKRQQRQTSAVDNAAYARPQTGFAPGEGVGHHDLPGAVMRPCRAAVAAACPTQDSTAYSRRGCHLARCFEPPSRWLRKQARHYRRARSRRSGSASKQWGHQRCRPTLLRD